ncbi:hypothetical protein D3C76_1565270 [compost metagenome]
METDCLNVSDCMDSNPEIHRLGAVSYVVEESGRQDCMEAEARRVAKDPNR